MSMFGLRTKVLSLLREYGVISADGTPTGALTSGLSWASGLGSALAHVRGAADEALWIVSRAGQGLFLEGAAFAWLYAGDGEAGGSVAVFAGEGSETPGDSYLDAGRGPAEGGTVYIGGSPGYTGAVEIGGAGDVVTTIYGKERSDPAAPSADHGVVYFRDNGSGKTQLVVRFATGAVQVLATEP